MLQYAVLSSSAAGVNRVVQNQFTSFSIIDHQNRLGILYHKDKIYFTYM